MQHKESADAMTDDEGPMVPLQLRMPKELIGRIDKFRRTLMTRPTRAWTIRYLLENALNISEAAKRDNTNGNEKNDTC